MRNVYVIALIFLLKCAFGKIECYSCEQLNLFPLSKLTAPLPIYADIVIDYSTFFILVFIIFKQEIKDKFEMQVAMILVAGKLLNYVLRGDEWWHFTIGPFIFSYDTFALFTFGILVLWYNLDRLLWNSG